MTTDAILLTGRDAGNAREVYSTHADRIARRTSVDTVAVATYESEPSRELRDQLAAIDADDVYAVPMTTAHSHDTLKRLPGALSAISGDVHYTEPIGRSPAVTEVVAARAREALAATDGAEPSDTTQAAATPFDTTLVLAAFGSSTRPYHRQVANYHAERLRERADYDAVTTCYLLQNPTVECARYDVATDHVVAVPLFVASSEATDERIPEELELDRGNIAYADPYGTHERLTDAIVAEVRKEQALATTTDDAAHDPAPVTGTGFGDSLTETRRPVATDGDGGAR